MDDVMYGSNCSVRCDNERRIGFISIQFLIKNNYTRLKCKLVIPNHELILKLKNFFQAGDLFVGENI